MVKLIKKEEESKYPKTAKDVLSISSIPNWVELDLSDFPKTSLVGTGLDNVKKSGVFIHPEDIPLLNSASVNFQEILSHSYGKASNGSLTYRPDGQSTRILVSVPINVMKAVKSITTLSDIDKLIGLKRFNTQIYTTGSGGIKGYVIPNSYYGIKEGRISSQITDFSCQYKSLVDLGKQDFIEKVQTSNLAKDQCLVLLIGLLGFTPQNGKDKRLKQDLLKSLVSSIDTSLFDEEVTEKVLKDNLDIIEDLGSDIFNKDPKIPVFTYNMYFSTQKQMNTFLDLLGKGKRIPSEVERVNVDRNTEMNIYVFRPDLKDEKDDSKKKHIISILTCPTGQFKISRAIKDWSDTLSFSPTGHLDKIS